MNFPRLVKPLQLVCRRCALQKLIWHQPFPGRTRVEVISPLLIPTQHVVHWFLFYFPSVDYLALLICFLFHDSRETVSWILICPFRGPVLQYSRNFLLLVIVGWLVVSISRPSDSALKASERRSSEGKVKPVITECWYFESFVPPPMSTFILRATRVCSGRNHLIKYIK